MEGGGVREDFVFSVLYLGEKYVYRYLYTDGVLARVMGKIVRLLDLSLIIHTTTTTTFTSELSYSSTMSFRPNGRRGVIILLLQGSEYILTI